MTTIKKCTCVNDYQDKKYGNGNRVMNQTQKVKPPQAPVYRCTVCAKEA